MGTELIDYEDCEKFNLNVLLKRYWGGDERGVMYQITEKKGSDRYVSLSHRDMIIMCHRFIESLLDD